MSSREPRRFPCPRCGESIPVVAEFCRFCNHKTNWNPAVEAGSIEAYIMVNRAAPQQLEADADPDPIQAGGTAAPAGDLAAEEKEWLRASEAAKRLKEETSIRVPLSTMFDHKDRADFTTRDGGAHSSYEVDYFSFLKWRWRGI